MAVPPAIVAIDGLLEVHMATLVISTTPLHVVAFALYTWVLGVPPTEMLATEGVITIDWIQPTVTVTV